MINFLNRDWYPWELLAVFCCVAALLYWLYTLYARYHGSPRSGRVWAATFRLVLRDPEILLLWLLSTAVSFAPFTLLYFAGLNPKTHAALLLLGAFAGSGEALSRFRGGPDTAVIAAVLAAVLAACFALVYVLARLLNFAAVYTAWRRLKGGEPGLFEALGAVRARLGGILSILADPASSAGYAGAFLPQYMMCEGLGAEAAAESSLALALRTAGQRAKPKGGVLAVALAVTRPAAELQDAILIGFIPAWLFSFYLTFGLGPADADLWWIIFGLFGSLLIYILAAANFVSFINSVYLTAFFFARGGGRSPLLGGYPPGALENPFR
jgi:hypothetical protein